MWPERLFVSLNEAMQYPSGGKNEKIVRRRARRNAQIITQIRTTQLIYYTQKQTNIEFHWIEKGKRNGCQQEFKEQKKTKELNFCSKNSFPKLLFLGRLAH